jgi:predicted nucleotidyltransferase
MHVQDQALYETVARTFAERALATVGDQIDAILLYGSVARREATEASDIDLLVVSAHVDRVRPTLAEIRTDLDLEHDTLTTLNYKTPDQLEDGLRRGDPYLAQIVTEGEALYDNGTCRRLRPRALAEG